MKYIVRDKQEIDYSDIDSEQEYNDYERKTVYNDYERKSIYSQPPIKGLGTGTAYVSLPPVGVAASLPRNIGAQASPLYQQVSPSASPLYQQHSPSFYQLQSPSVIAYNQQQQQQQQIQQQAVQQQQQIQQQAVQQQQVHYVSSAQSLQQPIYQPQQLPILQYQTSQPILQYHQPISQPVLYQQPQIITGPQPIYSHDQVPSSYHTLPKQDVIYNASNNHAMMQMHSKERLLQEKESTKMTRPPIKKLHENDDMTSRNKKKIWWCIPAKKSKRRICIGTIIVILGLLALIGWLLFPRMPIMKVEGIDVPPGLGSFQLSPVDLTAEIINFSLKMNMLMNVTVTNPNVYHLKIDHIGLSAWILSNGTMINQQTPSPAETMFSRNANPRKYVTNENYKVSIGSGSFDSITFPPNTPVKFQMPFTVMFQTNPQVGALNDPVVNELIQLCIQDPILSPRENRTTTIAYQAINSIKAVSWMGYNPTLENSLKINCPFQGPAKMAFIAALKGNTGAKG